MGYAPVSSPIAFQPYSPVHPLQGRFRSGRQRYSDGFGLAVETAATNGTKSACADSTRTGEAASDHVPPRTKT